MRRTFQTLRGLALLYAISIAICATVFVVAEHRSIGDAVWWATVTAMTVGYGDIYPATLPGRLAAEVLMHFVPLLIIPLVTAQLAAQLIVNSDAFTHSEQEEIKASIRRIEDRLR